MFKKILKIFSLLLKIFTLLLVFTLTTLWVWYFEPYINKEYSKLDKLEKIQTQYAGWACGSNSPQLTPYEIKEDGNLNYIAAAFTLSLAAKLPDPEESIAAVPGNKFTLWGYREKITSTNIFTGIKKENITLKIYLVGWEVKAPFNRYGKDGSYKRENKPLRFFIEDEKLAKLIFERSKQTSC